MPLPKETSNTVVPNSLIIPQIVLQTGIANGLLATSATITLQDAHYDQTTGRWVETGGAAKMLFIPDVMKLETDITGLQAEVDAVFGGLVKIIGQINSIRKVL